jgi:hypothetical protein
MGEGEQELPQLEMSKKMLPTAEIITTIIRVPESAQNLGCAPKNAFCNGVTIQCCDPYRCTLPVIGGICA